MGTRAKQSKTLWYFADPMCSWCWGFSSNLEKIRSDYNEKINIALMMGGLRPGTSESISDQLREEILHHWHHVHELTGQSFAFEGALPQGFVYDTEPACRAVITLADLNPDNVFPYFKSIQSAFYVDKIDVTKADNLTELAVQQGVTKKKFEEVFLSEGAKQKVVQHFQATRQAGVTGFPSLILQEGARHQFVSKGYRSYGDIANDIENWFKQEAT